MDPENDINECVPHDCQQEKQANYYGNQMQQAWPPEQALGGGLAGAIQGGAGAGPPMMGGGGDLATYGGRDYVNLPGAGPGGGYPHAQGPAPTAPHPSSHYLAKQLDDVHTRLRQAKQDCVVRERKCMELARDLCLMEQVANAFAKHATSRKRMPFGGIEALHELARQLEIITGKLEVTGEFATNSKARHELCLQLLEVVRLEIKTQGEHPVAETDDHVRMIVAGYRQNLLNSEKKCAEPPALYKCREVPGKSIGFDKAGSVPLTPLPDIVDRVSQACRAIERHPVLQLRPPKDIPLRALVTRYTLGQPFASVPGIELIPKEVLAYLDIRLKQGLAILWPERPQSLRVEQSRAQGIYHLYLEHSVIDLRQLDVNFPDYRVPLGAL